MMYELPETETQLKNVLSKVPSYDRYIKVKALKAKEGEKDTFKFDIK